MRLYTREKGMTIYTCKITTGAPANKAYKCQGPKSSLGSFIINKKDVNAHTSSWAVK